MTEFNNVYTLAANAIKEAKRTPYDTLEVYSDDDMIVVEKRYAYKTFNGESHIVKVIMKRKLNIHDYLMMMRSAKCTLIIENFEEAFEA